MQLIKIQTNMTELRLSSGERVLFSYNTPVACFTEDEFIQVNKKYSVTTTKHINKFFKLSGWKLATVRFESPDFFNNLVKAHNE